MIRGIHKCYLCRNSSHVLMLSLYDNVIAQILVSQTRKLLHMTQFEIQNDHLSHYFYPLFLHCWFKILSFLFSVNIPNLSLTEEKFESCIQNKRCKPQNQVEFLSRTCFFKTMIISDMKDFIKDISCSETAHVSTKQRLPGFDLTFQKWFVRFPNANNRKRYHNCQPPW